MQKHYHLELMLPSEQDQVAQVVFALMPQVKLHPLPLDQAVGSVDAPTQFGLLLVVFVALALLILHCGQQAIYSMRGSCLCFLGIRVQHQVAQ
jgi:hypothetical protein